jgi:hypothetical protein
MKRSISLMASLVLALSVIQIPLASAARVADCIELKFPVATSTSTVITLRVDVYATCTSLELGRGNGQRPLFSMPDEESLFNLSSCVALRPHHNLVMVFLGPLLVHFA